MVEVVSDDEQDELFRVEDPPRENRRGRGKALEKICDKNREEI